jgi:thiaminase/transcriptional activator TenA
MSLTRTFVERSGDLWQQALNHPFVQSIGSGALPVDKFRFYLVQDYLYLIAYSRVLALAVYRAPSVETMREMSALLHSTLETEMSLHRAYAAKFGVSRDELDDAAPAPTMLAYASYMLDIAARGDFLANLFSILPCAIGYAEIGAKLHDAEQSTKNTITQAPCTQRDEVAVNPYRDWIEMYAGDEFQEYARRLTEIADETASGLSAQIVEELYEIFAASTKYEWMFWEMAWTLEKWRI